MLILALIASIVFTAYCIWAGAHPPVLPMPVPAKTVSPAMAVIVQMIEDGGDDFDDDPPTVVQTKQK
jgi:hypothetical protein